MLFNIQLAVPKAIPKTLVSAIKYCIENKKYLDFNYSNRWSNVSGERFVICGALGRLKKGGRRVLRGYLVAGTSYSLSQGVTTNRWKIYLLQNINFFQVSDQGFYAKPAGYRKGDRSMSSIDAELEFDADIDPNDVIWDDE